MRAVRHHLWLLLVLAVPLGASAAPGDPPDDDVPAAPDDPPSLPDQVPEASDEAPPLAPPPLPDDPAPEGPGSASLDPLIPSYGEGWRWRRVSPVDGVGVTDVAAHPTNADRLVATTLDGVVWVSEDGGRSWDPVLGRRDDGLGEASRDEDILLDVEARLQEILDEGGDFGDSVPIDGEDDLDPSLADAIDDGTDELLTDIESDPGFTVRGADTEESLPARVAYVDDLLFATLDGRAYLSRNDGRSWGEVLDVHAWDVAGLGSSYVAVTEDGARVALDPRAWFDLVDGTEGTPLTEAARSGEVLLAASDTGLWATRDGETWRRWGDLRSAVRAVAVHPERPDVVWVVTDAGLLRSTDRGLTFGVPVLVGDTLTDVATPLPDRVVVARLGAVLESQDDGATWAVVTSGLEGVQDGRLETRPDGGLVLAASNGLWSLRRLGDADRVRSDVWLRLDALLSASLGRDGVRRSFDARRRRWTAAAVPTLRLEGFYQPDRSLGWNPNLGTDATAGGVWRVLGRLIWTPRQLRRTTFEPDDLDQYGVVVVGDEPLVITGTDDYVIAARLDKAVADYQAELSGLVTDLYRTRSELVAERTALSGARLQRRVLHELAIDEIEARLDALSDGAVRRWRSAFAVDTQEL